MLRFLQFSGFNSSVDAMDSQPRLRLQEICDRRMRVNITLERFIEYSILIRWFFSDIDECARGIHGCHHNCRNVPGSYFCSCSKGFQLSDDLKSCVGMCRSNTFECFCILRDLFESHNKLSSWLKSAFAFVSSKLKNMYTFR